MEFFENVSSLFKLIEGDFTEPVNKELIEKKANTIFANNWLFGDDLIGKLREILHPCAPGTHIVVTKLIDKTRFHKRTYLGHFNSFSHTGTLDSIDRPMEWSDKSFKFWVVKMDSDKDTECSQRDESFPEDPHHEATKEGKEERHQGSRRAGESEKESCSTLADNDVKIRIG
ncbi:hypothetical protein B9Z55_004248 [Caenorhabditis nigoni]|uniref:Histone-lysine N-methyltransferase, H3 lysine-79 specific n=1 Tax=Caenorhabditis nigoni TaxID=1611254 RepID=A0A2G5UVP2_9PELO|nr:hypothetical protein B9Z55_004248 [Caenorhabditis nigoni]